MKVSKRAIPQDVLSFEHKSYRVAVVTHGQYILTQISKNGEAVFSQTLTPEQFISLLMRDAQP